MIKYLENDAEGKPTCVVSATASHGDETPTGLVTSTIANGELFLFRKGDRSQTYRLRWSPDDEQRERPLPVGSYQVTGYRHIEAEKDGTEWIWSTTSPSFREIEVTADETTHCAVRTGLVVKARAFERKGQHRIGVVFQAEKRLGNTLYRRGKRIGLTWQCLNADGDVLAEGAMRYG